jgi:dTDP-4-dehydrorhamnose 3,5-epimerase
MKIKETSIQGLMVVETEMHADNRGGFARLYCQDELKNLLGEREVVQINYSHTSAIGAVRGLHYQRAPNAEMKMVRCLKGRVWDVAVDLRAGSQTFLEWHSEELSASNGFMMVIPEGFGHGFQVLEKDSELLYLHTAFYAPAAEGGFAHDDSRLKITWPLPVSETSFRDQQLPSIPGEFSGVNL